MEKLHSQLPQPLKRCSPARHTAAIAAADLLTQIKSTNTPLAASQPRSPARRTLTSSYSSPRSRAAALTPPEVKSRSPEVASRSREPMAARRPANESASPVSAGKSGRQTAVRKQSPVKSLVVRTPVKSKSAQVRLLRSPVESSQRCDDDNYNENENYGGVVSRQAHPNIQLPSSSGIFSGPKKSPSPHLERRTDVKKVDPEDSPEDKSNEGGSPIYHELDPPGVCRLPVQHTYQSIVEISDELDSLRRAASQNGSTEPLARTKSAQELAQKSPTKPSLFSRFRFAAKKSSSAAGSAKGSEVARGKDARRPAAAEVRGQSSLQDDNLISRSRDDDDHHQYGVVVAATTHDRQPSFTTFAGRTHQRAGQSGCDADGYSTVYVPQTDTDRSRVPVPPRTSSLSPARLNDAVLPGKPSPEPLYRKKFRKIASVHTIQSSPVDVDGERGRLTGSNSVGDLLMASQSPRTGTDRVTSYDDHAAGSRKMTSENKSRIARYGLSPGRVAPSVAAASFSSPSCGVRMAEMRVAVRRCTTDPAKPAATAPSRSPSSSTPVPTSPARISVFQFNVPPPGVMTSPPVQRAFRHVSSQTVTSVRPPSASCVLSVAMVHGPNSSTGPVGQMQTIEEEDDLDDATDHSSPSHSPDDRLTNGAHAESGDDDKTGMATMDDHESRHPQPSEAASGTAKSASKLRRPSKPLPHRSGSPLVDQQPSRIAGSSSTSTTPPRWSESPTTKSAEPAVRRTFARGQRKLPTTVAPAGGDDDCLSSFGVRSKLPGAGRRLLLAPTDAAASPTPSSGSTVSTGSEPDVPRGLSPAPDASINPAVQSRPSHSRLVQPKHSSVASRVSKINELSVLATDHVNY